MLLLPASLAAAGAIPGASNLGCDLPPALTTPEAPLPHVAQALSDDRPLRILAVGSGSTVGESSGSPDPAAAAQLGSSFPYQMAAALRSALPDDVVELAVDGGRNMTAETM